MKLDPLHFSYKVEREDVVVTTDGEAYFYDKHTSSRKEVLWRKVEAFLQSFGSAGEEDTLVAYFVPTKDSNPE